MPLRVVRTNWAQDDVFVTSLGRRPILEGALLMPHVTVSPSSEVAFRTAGQALTEAVSSRYEDVLLSLRVVRR